MKSNQQPSFYFSAYPLKAIPKSSENTGNQSPYLRSILAGGSRMKTTGRARVFPMINPYKASAVRPRIGKLTKDVDATGDGWFNHYE